MDRREILGQIDPQTTVMPELNNLKICGRLSVSFIVLYDVLVMIIPTSQSYVIFRPNFLWSGFSKIHFQFNWSEFEVGYWISF